MFVLHFGSPEIKLETAGGKGLNLARLARAGFNVPRGFIISTDAYRAFVDANRWLAGIGSTVGDITADDVCALEKLSAQIRASFSVGVMPPEIALPSALRVMISGMSRWRCAPRPQRRTCRTCPLRASRIPISM